MSTSTPPPTTFNAFQNLPPEIRSRIFTFASNASPRTIDIWTTFTPRHLTSSNTTIYTQSYSSLLSPPSPPPLLSATHESRRQCLKSYSLEWEAVYPHPSIEWVEDGKWYVNYNTDLCVLCGHWNVASFDDFMSRTWGRIRRIAISVNWSFWEHCINPAIKKGEVVFWDGLEEIVLFDEDDVVSEDIDGEVVKIGKMREMGNLASWEKTTTRWKENGKKTTLEFEELSEREYEARSHKLKDVEKLLRDYFVSLNHGETVAEDTKVNDIDRGVNLHVEDAGEAEEISFASTTTLNEPEWSFSSTAETVAEESDTSEREDGEKVVVEETPTLLDIDMPKIKIMKMVLRVNKIQRRDSTGKETANDNETVLAK